MNREMELAVQRIMKKEDVTEVLKKRNPIEWVSRAKGLKSAVERVVLESYINQGVQSD
jgi:hypothetical protein